MRTLAIAQEKAGHLLELGSGSDDLKRTRSYSVPSAKNANNIITTDLKKMHRTLSVSVTIIAVSYNNKNGVAIDPTCINMQ